MKERLQSIWEAVHISFWFVPCLMAVGAFPPSLATVSFDQKNMRPKRVACAATVNAIQQELKMKPEDLSADWKSFCYQMLPTERSANL